MVDYYYKHIYTYQLPTVRYIDVVLFDNCTYSSTNTRCFVTNTFFLSKMSHRHTVAPFYLRGGPRAAYMDFYYLLYIISLFVNSFFSRVRVKIVYDMSVFVSLNVRGRVISNRNIIFLRLYALKTITRFPTNLLQNENKKYIKTIFFFSNMIYNIYLIAKNK